MKINKERLEKVIDFISTAHKISKEEAAKRVQNMGPKQLNKFEVLETGGWRPGFTRETLEKRKQRRRNKEKNRRKVNAKMRRK